MNNDSVKRFVAKVIISFENYKYFAAFYDPALVRDGLGTRSGRRRGRKERTEGRRKSRTKGGQLRILQYAKNEDYHGGRRQDNLPAKTTGAAPLSDIIRTEEGVVGWQNVNLQSVRKRAFCKV